MTEPGDRKDVFHPTERFTMKARDYALYRPRYPAELMDLLRQNAGLGPGMVVADIGSGTGILTEPLLAQGCIVYAVEPNLAMRRKAEDLLHHVDRFHSIAGRAEATTLPDASVDLIAIGQAFHWFELAPTKTEFLRILKPGGWLCLVWNRRDPEGGEFETKYNGLVEMCCPAATKVKELGPSEGEIAAFYDHPYLHVFLPNYQDLDLEGLRGRFLSASYAPDAHDPGFISAMEGLEGLFVAHSVNGMVRFHYQTEVFMGRLGP